MDNKEEVKENTVLLDLESNKELIESTRKIVAMDHERSLLDYKRSKFLIDDLEDCALDRKILIKHSENNVRNYVIAEVVHVVVMLLLSYVIFTKV